MALRPEILRFKRDFDRLYKRGRSAGNEHVVIFHISNGLGYSRKAFLASKKVGGAVARNRARRLMKESFRKIESELLPGKDVLLIARKEIVTAGGQEVEKSIRKTLTGSGLLNKGNK